MKGNAPDEEHEDPHGECRHEIERLRGALEGLSAMYSSAWDLSDGGGLIMLPPSMERFEAAHAAARVALGFKDVDPEEVE